MDHRSNGPHLDLRLYNAGHRNVRQQIAEKILESITKEQAETIFPVLDQEQISRGYARGAKGRASGSKLRPSFLSRSPHRVDDGQRLLVLALESEVHVIFRLRQQPP